MPNTLNIKEGQHFQDGTGLTVRVAEIDANERVHFSVIEDQGLHAPGEMSYLAFVNRFTRIKSLESACASIRQLGYVAHRRVRIYGEDFELLSDPFPDNNRIAIRARAKDSSIRTLRLPLTLAQGGQERGTIKAA